MKKNLISVLILALVFANFMLTAILMFSVLPQTKKANELITKVCQAIDLDLNSGASSALGNIPMDKREEYRVNGGQDIQVTLAASEDKKSHFAIVNITIVLNKGSDNYKKYNQEFLNGQDSTIRNVILTTISRHTVEEMRKVDVQLTVQDELREEMQAMFGGDYIIAVNFSKCMVE